MIFILGHLTKMATMPIYGKIKSLNNKPKLTLTLLRISGERFRSSSYKVLFGIVSSMKNSTAGRVRLTSLLTCLHFSPLFVNLFQGMALKGGCVKFAPRVGFIFSILQHYHKSRIRKSLNIKL